MGGFGSGERLSKKRTVEECLNLSVGRLVKQGSLKPQTLSVGELTWTNKFEERILLVRYWLENTLQKTVLHLTSRVDRNGRPDVGRHCAYEHYAKPRGVCAGGSYAH